MLETNFTELFRTIADELGDGWSAKEGHWPNGQDALLFGPQGEEIHVTAGGWRKQDDGRFAFAADLYKYRDYLRHEDRLGGCKREISVSQSKTAKKIAAEVERRLLPTYREVLERGKEAKRKSDERKSAQAVFTRNLADEVGVTPTGRDGHIEFGQWQAGVNGKVDVPTGDFHVDFTVRVPHTKALEFARILGEFRSR